MRVSAAESSRKPHTLELTPAPDYAERDFEGYVGMPCAVPALHIVKDVEAGHSDRGVSLEGDVNILSAIHHLLAQSLNHPPTVIVGLLFWVAAYVQLYWMKPDTIGEVVTLVFSVLPIGAAVVSFIVTATRWGGKTTWVAVVFLLFGIVSLGCFLWMYLGDSSVRKVLEEREVFTTRKAKTAALILQVLLGAISVLASVTLLVSGGWELIQGSVTIGLVLAPVGAVTLVLDRWPEHRLNIFERSYSALTE